MANIKINELNPVGAELFLDSDSFLNELSESEEIINIHGGLTSPHPCCNLTNDILICDF
ncbi:MAG: hypothetical protein QNJ47_00725 [Nostocaceae cyanobacterium]|nr:hypothetical protein [Nostocaceae cyanobacterium]